MTRSELINLIIEQNNYKKYLEIGVNTPAQPGWNFDNINTEIKHGVDPKVDTTFKVTSNEFFDKHIKIKYDIIFVDGLHLFEQAYKDIMNSLKWLEEDGTIVVHDCNPTEEITQRRKRASNAWHGDVWKAILKLRIENPDIQIYTVNTDEGCAVIRKGGQKLLKIKNQTKDIYNYEFFNSNRKKILNLISVDKFKKNIAKTIIIKLQGGLGNQMFQYAIGKALSKKNNINLKLDLSFYDRQQNGPLRYYFLKHFNIVENIANTDEIDILKKNRQKNGWQHFFYSLFFTKKTTRIKEKQFDYDKNILNISNSVYLDGYWQSEKYFKNIENIIKKEFTLKNKLPIQDIAIVEKIKISNSVSIHVRREDYVDNKTHNTLPIKYYMRAIGIIAEKNSDIHLFVFSNNIEWAKNNLKSDFPTTFMEGNKDYEDLILMSLCKHNIIANSSFSWWAAWLNKNPNKIIITPQKWFNKTEINTKDLIPKSWIQI